MDPSFEAFVVREQSKQCESARVESLGIEELPAGEVTIAVEWTSLNFKDALAACGHPGVAGSLPHVPGIDCAGRVVESHAAGFVAGDRVLVTGYGLGAEAWGGWSELVRVPGEWVVAMPDGLDARSAMVIGTAGFTAAQCVGAIVDRGITADAGRVLVTGATGGVGCWAVRLLAKLGYQVVAMTGKQQQAEALRELGATEVVGRDVLADDSKKPLLRSQWAAAVDTVGGQPLANLVRSTNHRGVVACCGLVAGTELPLTVYPFLLRGVTLAGIDSAKCPRDARMNVWKRLSTDWQSELPEQWITETSLQDAKQHIQKILAGEVAGRTIVKVR